ncbi:hypothetical protein [Methylophilus sp. YYY-1]|uniref:hypothetical protein n=1 Tax=Methylophilus sp. YYY-1 TaxID=2682087 RepID=UPI0023B2ABF8|nr:hypothetical protein [Methylophilus sp. YYY-1]MDF0377663.1 hypothetical protein [Methylophilus sp. YYY-1]
MIDQIDNILFYLRNSDSKKPMKAETLAAKLELSMERFEEIMNVICNIVPAPVNRAYREVTENIQKKIPAFKGYVYWPTGVIDKAHWKDFKPASAKPAAQPIRTEKSIPKVSTDTYETPVFGQPTISDAPAAPDYSDKPKAYQILKYIEANPGTTSKPIENLLRLTSAIKPYIKGYLDREEVIDANSENGRIYRVTKPVDEFYRHCKVAENKQPGAKDAATPIPQQPQETTATDTVDAQGHEVESSGFAADQASQTFTDSRENEIHQTQVEHDHPVVDEPARYRFAYTNDGCLMLMTFGQLPIELNRHETQLLISFLDDQLTLMRVV